MKPQIKSMNVQLPQPLTTVSMFDVFKVNGRRKKTYCRLNVADEVYLSTDSGTISGIVKSYYEGWLVLRPTFVNYRENENSVFKLNYICMLAKTDEPFDDTMVTLNDEFITPSDPFRRESTLKISAEGLVLKGRVEAYSVKNETQLDVCVYPFMFRYKHSVYNKKTK